MVLVVLKAAGRSEPRGHHREGRHVAFISAANGGTLRDPHRSGGRRTATGRGMPASPPPPILRGQTAAAATRRMRGGAAARSRPVQEPVRAFGGRSGSRRPPNGFRQPPPVSGSVSGSESKPPERPQGRRRVCQT